MVAAEGADPAAEMQQMTLAEALDLAEINLTSYSARLTSGRQKLWLWGLVELVGPIRLRLVTTAVPVLTAASAVTSRRAATTEMVETRPMGPAGP